MAQPFDRWLLKDTASGQYLAYANNDRKLSEAVLVPFGDAELVRSDDEETARWRAGYMTRFQSWELEPQEGEVEFTPDAPAEEAEPEPQTETEPDPAPEPQPEPEQPDTTAVLWLTDADRNRLTVIEDGATLDAPEGGLFNLELVPAGPVDRVEFDTTAGPRTERVQPFHAFSSRGAEPAEGEREVVARIFHLDGTETTLRRQFRF